MGLQSLHLSNAFWHLNVSESMGLKSSALGALNLGETTETITTHLREVHYRLAIVCDLCRSFASMSVQVVLEH